MVPSSFAVYMVDKVQYEMMMINKHIFTWS